MDKLYIKISIEFSNYIVCFILFFVPLAFLAIFVFVAFFVKNFWILLTIMPIMIFFWVDYCLARKLKNQTFELDSTNDTFRFDEKPTCIAYLACSYHKEYVVRLSEIETFQILPLNEEDSSYLASFDFVLTQRNHFEYRGKIVARYDQLYAIGKFIINYHSAIGNRVSVLDNGFMGCTFYLGAKGSDPIEVPHPMDAQQLYQAGAQQPHLMHNQLPDVIDIYQPYPTSTQQPCQIINQQPALHQSQYPPNYSLSSYHHSSSTPLLIEYPPPLTLQTFHLTPFIGNVEVKESPSS